MRLQKKGSKGKVKGRHPEIGGLGGGTSKRKRKRKGRHPEIGRRGGGTSKGSGERLVRRRGEWDS